MYYFYQISSPVLQIFVTNTRVSPFTLKSSDFIMYAILLERTNSATGVCNKFREVPGLIGTIVSNMYELKGLDGQMGQYFMFPDLSVNREGQYHLRVRGSIKTCTM